MYNNGEARQGWIRFSEVGTVLVMVVDINLVFARLGEIKRG